MNYFRGLSPPYPAYPPAYLPIDIFNARQASPEIFHRHYFLICRYLLACFISSPALTTLLAFFVLQRSTFAISRDLGQLTVAKALNFTTPLKALECITARGKIRCQAIYQALANVNTDAQTYFVQDICGIGIHPGPLPALTILPDSIATSSLRKLLWAFALCLFALLYPPYACADRCSVPGKSPHPRYVRPGKVDWRQLSSRRPPCPRAGKV